MASMNKVSLRGLNVEEFAFTFLLASGITASDIGKAVTLNGTNNTVALAGDGDRIIGVLASFEDRSGVEGIKVGTVYTKGGHAFPLNPSATTSSPDETPVAGEFIVGGTHTGSLKGYVQKAQSADLQAGKTNWVVVEVYTENSVTYVVAVSA